MERLKHMKETLMNAVQGQLGDLSSVDAKELGEVVDMIKDLSEAVYYCTIVKSMEDSEKEKPQHHYYTPMYRDMDRDMGRIYYDAPARNYYGGSRMYTEDYSNPVMIRDHREGQSPLTRKTYMERKMHGGDKTVQMHELEKYMQELTGDLMEMIEGASADEKQILQKKLSMLATKIV